MLADVRSPIDLRNMDDAKEWESSVMLKRPCRVEFFSCFADQIAKSEHPIKSVLELGSGPGFLARFLLESLNEITCTLLDFSPAMHQLAKERLGKLSTRSEFLEKNFKQLDWLSGLGKFDCVVTNQAVHELRHKRYALELHSQVRSLLPVGGMYLVCDHFVGVGGMENDQLYMTVEEQRRSLFEAGFTKVDQVMLKSSLVMHRASSE